MNDYKTKLHNLILTAEREGASDIHLAHDRKPILRIDGQLIVLEQRDVYSKDDTFGILRTMVSEEKVKQVINKEEIDFTHETEEGGRLRVSAYVQSGGLNLTLRLVKKIRKIYELNLPDILTQFTRKKQGLFLIVGPVGQGKSTTMAALIDKINEERREHIVTIENPVEYIFEDKQSLVDQREIGIDTHDFDSALKAVFRQDVNVIMVGEMRSKETISTVVTAAETGHLVFSTLHTNTAAQTIDRIIDSFPPDQQDQVRMQLANSLLGIFSQRLIKSQKGGRVPAYELMINNKATANLIRLGRTNEIDTVIETSQADGMVDMNRSLVRLVQEGHLSVEDAFRHSTNPKLLESML